MHSNNSERGYIMGKCIMCGKEAELNESGICKSCFDKMHSSEQSRNEVINSTNYRKTPEDKKRMIIYAILAIIAIVLFVTAWPLALLYIMVASAVLAITQFKRSKKVGITFTVISAFLVFALIYGIYNPQSNKTTDQDIISQAAIAVSNSYSSLSLRPEIDNPQISQVGNRQYKVVGTMDGATGGFVYRVEAIIEVSPDGTETRADQISAVCIN